MDLYFQCSVNFGLEIVDIYLYASPIVLCLFISCYNVNLFNNIIICRYNKMIYTSNISLEGSNMLFYSLTSAEPWGKRWGFQHLPWGPADVNASENCVWSLLLHKNILTCNIFRKLWRNCVGKFVFSVGRNPQKGTLTTHILKTTLPGHRLKTWWCHVSTFATVHVTGADVTFYDGPGTLTFKTANPCINSTWIALLIHGFVPVKTWLLITCGTAVCAII